MGPGGIHTAQRFQRLLRTEARHVGDHHLGQADDGIERGAQLMAHTGEELRLVFACLRELPVLSWISSNRRTFSIAITAWSAKVVTSSICLSVNGSTVLRVKTSTPVGMPSRSIGTPRTVRTLANPDPTVSLISASALVSTT